MACGFIKYCWPSDFFVHISQTEASVQAEPYPCSFGRQENQSRVQAIAGLNDSTFRSSCFWKLHLSGLSSHCKCQCSCPQPKHKFLRRAVSSLHPLCICLWWLSLTHSLWEGNTGKLSRGIVSLVMFLLHLFCNSLQSSVDGSHANSIGTSWRPLKNVKKTFGNLLHLV